jgi:L-alanine-DL-glutamate epimerase-like enolase superfamily enzyme
MPAYASGGWAAADQIGAQLQGYVARGFGAVKMRIGAFDGSPFKSAERVKAARAALGPDIDLMCDAHGTFTVSEAKQFCHLARDCNIAWLEEPVTAMTRVDGRAAPQYDIPSPPRERECGASIST